MFLENLTVSEKITKFKAQTPHTTWVGGWGISHLEKGMTKNQCNSRPCYTLTNVYNPFTSSFGKSEEQSHLWAKKLSVFIQKKTQTMECKMDYSGETLEFWSQCIRRKKSKCWSLGGFNSFPFIFLCSGI